MRNLSRIFQAILSSLLLGAAAVPAAAQVCNPCPGAPLDVGMCGTPDIVHTGGGCSFNYCQTPQVEGTPTFQLFPQPDGSVTARMVVQVTAPWNETAQQSNPNGTLDMTWFDVSPAPVPWTSGGNPSLCEYLASDRVNTYVEKTGLTCAGAPYDFGTYSLRASMCGGPCPPPFFPNCGPFCGRWIDKGGYEFKITKKMLNCPEPKRWDCDICYGCQEVGGEGKGGGSKGGGPGTAAPGGSGPGAFLRYAASGAGGPGFPGTAIWQPLLGRYWSHDYAERIVLDPVTGNDSHVWLLTKTATFREFSKAGTSAGPYTAVTTGDEYRKLARTAGGWTLQELDGTVHSYDASGRWTSTVDPNGNAKQATYDLATGRLTHVAFPDLRREDFSYTGAGRLSAITEVGIDGSTARTWTYTWSGDDLTRIGRPDGTAWEMFYADAAHPGYLTRMDLVGIGGAARRVEAAWEYDAAGNVVKLWRGDTSYGGAAAVSKWTFAFDNTLLPTQTTITDPLGKSSTYNVSRDPGSGKPRVTAINGDCPSCGLGPNAQLFYEDPANPLRVTRQIDGRGTTTLFAYDANGMMTAKTEASGSPLARTATYQYAGPFPALATRSDRPSTSGSGSRATVTAYDAAGNPQTQTMSGVEAGSAFSYSLTTTFSPQGKPALVDPPGYGALDQTTYAYDPARGNQLALSRTDPLVGTTAFAYDPLNRRTVVTDVNGVQTVTSYDSLDRVAAVVRKGATSAGDLTTAYEYDALGQVARVTLPAGNVLEYGYDAAGRVIRMDRKPDAATPGERMNLSLDAFGNRTHEERQRWNGATWVTDSATDYVYSSRCHLDKVVFPDGTATELAYDCDGNLEKVWDANHPSANQSNPPTRSYTYDLLDRITAEAQPWTGGGGGAATTLYAYDVQDHANQVTDANGTVTRTTYSDRDLPTQEISEVAGTTSYSYNEHGSLVSRTDGRGVTVSYAVDPLDRTTFSDFPDNSLDVTETYDAPGSFALGRLTSVQRNGQSVDYAYDRFGRMTQDGALGYVYDKNGNRTEIDYPGGVKATYAFDFADREAQLALQDGAAPSLPVVSGASYLADGPLAGLTLGNGLAESRTFNARYFPSTLRVPGRLDWSFATDGMGNVSGVTDNLNAAASRAFAYQDVFYFLTQGNGPWGSRAWTYDRIGNRISETRNGVTDSYAYAPNAAAGASPRLSQIARGGGGSASYFYDLAGDLTYRAQGGDKLRLAYGADQRLAQLRGESATGTEGLSQLSYDGRGLLRRSQLSLLTGSAVQEEADPTYSSEGSLYHRLHLKQPGPGAPRNAASLRSDGYVLYFAARPVALFDKRVTTPPSGAPTSASVLTLLTTDPVGTPVLATDATGSTLWSGGFEPFGGDWNGAQAAGVFLRLPGQWSDAAWDGAALASGLSYNVARWYEGATARYETPDPLGLLADLHPYRYAAQNPLRFTDPLGLFLPIIHNHVTQLATEGTCMAGDAGKMGKLVAGVDSLPGSQDPKNSFMHAMCAPGETYAHGAQAFQNHMQNELDKCTPEDLAQAVHAFEDSFAPGHQGCQTWHGMPWHRGGEGVWSSIRHFWGDLGADREVVQQVQDMLKAWCKKCRCPVTQ
jgi:RHS repeat-associated protein